VGVRGKTWLIMQPVLANGFVTTEKGVVLLEWTKEEESNFMSFCLLKLLQQQ
jgi:hypothetical protein